ncbi:NAD(P)-dependent dehydrogenase (short-subunit alcohol dehydrogenase family) [Lewinella aquimaris]|uniref:NAD(P)-dependent dehydrogenase (Short-subunit alcohol dehydrogenase family) n=1 Tax=Neolewinella aquimaris TaxID=1835722 RepID=A0A840EGH8_9BACT|nr:glucose 1-dehydrogenase [Neolewinella aquimaris]MBB4080919.1 NAD(P)-dependent dehydrogenase (short-subunit alcohol dehydrogenase family) [Neolewinella aquimaris]
MTTRIRTRFDLTDRVAIVTGSSKGIGEAMARGLAEFGAKVIVSSRSQEAVDEVAATYREDGLEATGIACHVGDPAARQQLIDRTIATYGRLDILINNAATNPYYGPVEGLTAAAYQKTMDVNLTAALELSNLALPHLRASGKGSVIHISSIEGLHANANFAAYNISKAGIIMLGKSQATEWAADNIRVNVICPGLVKTKLSRALWEDERAEAQWKNAIPLNRMATPDELAGLAVYLASDAASYVTGTVVVADGGMLG